MPERGTTLSLDHTWDSCDLALSGEAGRTRRTNDVRRGPARPLPAAGPPGRTARSRLLGDDLDLPMHAEAVDDRRSGRPRDERALVHVLDHEIADEHVAPRRRERHRHVHDGGAPRAAQLLVEHFRSEHVPGAPGHAPFASQRPGPATVPAPVPAAGCGYTYGASGVSGRLRSA